MHNLFSDLKAKTYNKHEELEHSTPFALFHNMAGCNDNEAHEVHRGNYLNVLCVMREFHQHCKLVINDATEKYPTLQALANQFETQAVITALDNDLAELNSFSAQCTSELQSVDLPNFQTLLSATISAMYVWLGSSMGANIISRRLEKSDYGFPTHYYQSMAKQAKAWPEFKQEVVRLLPLIIEGADVASQAGSQVDRQVDRQVESRVESQNSETLSVAMINDANLWFDHLILLGKSTNLPPQTLS
jgi:heme oxygenase